MSQSVGERTVTPRRLLWALAFVASAAFGVALPFTATAVIGLFYAEVTYSDLLTAIFGFCILLGATLLLSRWLESRGMYDRLDQRLEQNRKRKLGPRHEPPRAPRVTYGAWSPAPARRGIPFALELTAVVSGMLTSTAGLLLTMF